MHVYSDNLIATVCINANPFGLFLMRLICVDDFLNLVITTHEYP